MNRRWAWTVSCLLFASLMNVATSGLAGRGAAGGDPDGITLTPGESAYFPFAADSIGPNEPAVTWTAGARADIDMYVVSLLPNTWWRCCQTARPSTSPTTASRTTCRW